MKKLVVGLFVSSFLLGLVGMADASLINGSFEMGSFSPPASPADPGNTDIMFLSGGDMTMPSWEVIASPGNSVGWVGANNLIIGGATSIPASLGNKFLELTGASNTAANGVQQSISTTIGQQYRLSFDLGTSKHGTPENVGILASAEDLSGVLSSGVFSRDALGDTTGWHWGSHSLLFTATEAQTLIKLTGNTTANYTGLDNVSVSAVPVPSSIILMGSGLIGLVGFGYRRKKQTT